MKMPKKIRSLDNSVFYIIIGVLLALGINWGLAFALNTDMPVVAVESNSMVPTFSRGDILILQGIPGEQIKVGDIIVFSPGPQQTPVVHRIIEVNPDGTFQTKGDNNNGQLPFEKSIEPSQIHGKTILIIPYLGWLKIGMMEYALPNLLWFILAGGIIALIYMGVKLNRKSGFLAIGDSDEFL
ncbi:MAG: signal peptidase I [Candidatus Aenigmarchaeota archaeon]|nr:signal peptidase I [Candidatus Aenigmarchaeota archaeon]